jgi:hypothetical protein
LVVEGAVGDIEVTDELCGRGVSMIEAGKGARGGREMRWGEASVQSKYPRNANR